MELKLLLSYVIIAKLATLLVGRYYFAQLLVHVRANKFISESQTSVFPI